MGTKNDTDPITRMNSFRKHKIDQNDCNFWQIFPQFHFNLEIKVENVKKELESPPCSRKFQNVKSQFCVKSILEEFECQKLPFFTIAETLKFEFW